MFQNLRPVPVFPRAAAVALVDDDEVEKVGVVAVVVGFEDFFGMLLVGAPGERLVDGEKYIGVRRDDASLLFDKASVDFEDVLFERVEGVHRLVHEDIAIGEDEDSRPAFPDAVLGPPGLEELVGDLERYHGLSRTGGEREEDSVFPVRDGFHGFRDGDFLVVSRAFGGDEVRFPLEDFPDVVRFAERPSVEGFGAWVIFHVFPGSGFEVEFVDFLAVGRVEVPDREHFAVFLDLFESFGRVKVVFLRFDDGEIDPVVLEEVIGVFLLSLAADELAAVGERVFADDVGIGPAVSFELGVDVFGAGVGFGMHFGEVYNIMGIFQSDFFDELAHQTLLSLLQDNWRKIFLNEFSIGVICENRRIRGRMENSNFTMQNICNWELKCIMLVTAPRTGSATTAPSGSFFIRVFTVGRRFRCQYRS
jgi:hypothetical protein